MGAGIDKTALQSTGTSLASTLEEFQKAEGRQVSAHYVIDRTGDVYERRAPATMPTVALGANESSIGIEHVGGENDPLTAPQAACFRSTHSLAG